MPSEPHAAEEDTDPLRPDFDALFERFERDELTHEQIMELIELGMKLRRVDATRRLFAFTPDNMAEEIRRKFLLAEFYLEADTPLVALIILRTVSLATLGREERRNALLKIAYCYQCLQQYEAAYAVYLRILGEDPNVSMVEQLARLNYGRYLSYVSGGATALERITTI
jgi:tetratricopeptide (TPR) repeat protein